LIIHFEGFAPIAQFPRSSGFLFHAIEAIPVPGPSTAATDPSAAEKHKHWQ